jgi:hypothetical protein
LVDNYHFKWHHRLCSSPSSGSCCHWLLGVSSIAVIAVVLCFLLDMAGFVGGGLLPPITTTSIARLLLLLLLVAAPSSIALNDVSGVDRVSCEFEQVEQAPELPLLG